MYLSVPITGTVISINPLIGDPDDPIRPIEVNLGSKVGWELVSIDLENDLALIDVYPADKIDVPTGGFDEDGFPITEVRGATIREKQSFLNNAKQVIQSKSIDELYKVSKSARLKKPINKGMG